MKNIVKSFVLSVLMSCAATVAVATNPLYRYVKTAQEGGAYTNDGLSWSSAKSNVQDAINELKDYMNLQGISEGGYVFVAKGVYKPTESTSNTSQLPQFLSFKIYSGVNVWGGWYGDEVIPDGSTDAEIFDLEPKVVIQGPSGDFVLNQFETILDGNLSDDAHSQATFVWSNERQRYVTTFPSNVYHVVTFATNGFDANGHARPLAAKASLNVVTIRGGRAFNSDASEAHPYNAYGGGVYMVGNASMDNSRVSECEASRDGGGVYLDGGGMLKHSIITDCQALGLGVQYGRGGGACIDQAGNVEQSYLLNNVSREGAGLGIYYNESVAHTIDPKYHTYSAICKSSLIANNTATTEAGGIYMDGGGVLDGVTVARNRCNGVGALINNIMTGQSAGVFMVGPARAYNSVFWGGQIGNTASMEDLQFAAYNNGQESQKSLLAYVALNNNDLVNWSYSSTKSIMSLANETSGHEETFNYPAFDRTSPLPGVMPNLKASQMEGKTQEEIKALLASFGLTFAKYLTFNVDGGGNITGIRSQVYTPGELAGLDEATRASVVQTMMLYFVRNLSDGMFYVSSFSFKPSAVSALAGAGVQLSDLKAEPGVDLKDAELTQDILNFDYSPLCDLGAYNAKSQQTSHATTVNYLESDAGSTMTLFVDPERASSAGDSNIGSSWSTPFKHLRDALHYVWQYKQGLAAYNDSVSKSLSPHVAYTDFAHYQVLVKEGTIHTAATATNERISVSSIYMIDGVSVYGGFPKELTGIQIENGNIKRNPIVYPSVVTGSYSDAGYETNVGHLVNFCSVSNAIFDGFQLRYGNASGTVERELGSIVSFDGGGGFVLTNAFHYDGTGLAQNSAQQIAAMSGNKVRNCIVTGCTARMGAAVFTYAPIRTISATFENCIFHNNSVLYGTDQTVADLRDAGKEMSIIRLVSGTNFTFNHCDIIRNVGVGIDAQAGATLVLNNNVFYANLDRPVQNTNGFDQIAPGQEGFAKMCAPIVNGGATISGHNNQFDYLFGHGHSASDEEHRAIYRFSETDDFDRVNMVEATSSANERNLTYSSSDNANFTYPLFKNATRNAGLSVEGDITFFGGVTDWMPNAMSPLVNSGFVLSVGYDKDMTANSARTYGGTPDVGAIENSVDQPLNPSYTLYEKNNGPGTEGDHDATYTQLATYYVRDYGDDHTKGGDGSSWNAAINGNADYDLTSGKLAIYASGSVQVEEMVDSYEPSVDKTSASTYRLYNKDAQLYMTNGGVGTADMQQALQFVFIKTGNFCDYWNGFRVPTYKFYYFVLGRTADKVYTNNGERYYWDGTNMHLESTGAVVGNTTAGYTPVYLSVTKNSVSYDVYELIVEGMPVYYYQKEGLYYRVDDDTEYTGGLGMTRSQEEINERYNRQEVGYLQFVSDGHGSYNIGSTNEVSSATEFILSGEPGDLYIAPVQIFDNVLTKLAGITMTSEVVNGHTIHHVTVSALLDGSGDPNTFSKWSISSVGSANRYRFLGYRLKSSNVVNTVAAGTYVSKETYTKNSITTLKGTTVNENKEIIHYEGHINHNDGHLTATLTTNSNKGFYYTVSGKKYTFKLDNTSSNWIVSLNMGSGTYTVRTEDGVAHSTWEKNGSNIYLALATTGDEIQWKLEPVYERISSSNKVNGLQYAIMSANKAYNNDHQEHQIWVAEGTYTKDNSLENKNIDGVNLKFYHTYKLLEGASLYGGFPNVGNPTMAERNPKQYETFLQALLGKDPKTMDYDATRTGARVLYQADDYTQETHVDGFTIRYGYLNQAFVTPINNDLDNIYYDGGSHKKIKQNIKIGLAGGAGALIRTGLVFENCKVTENMCYYNPYEYNGFLGIGKRVQTGEKFIVSNDGKSYDEYHVLGGGVSSLGASIKNCEIVDNRISAYRKMNSSLYSYGAGLFMTEGSVYNTVISGNEIEGSSLIDLGAGNNLDIRAGVGVYLYGGKFFNNTVVGNTISNTVTLTANLKYCVYIPGVFIHNNVTMYNTIVANNTISNISFDRYNVSGKAIYGYPVACIGSGWNLLSDRVRAENCCIINSQANGFAYINGSKNYANREQSAQYGEQVAYNQGRDFAYCKNNIFVNPNLDGKYHETAASPTINSGTETIPGVLIPELDAAYEKRIQDCQIDMGAYEHNSASNVTPTVNGTSATFFVNASGVGSATAHDAGNAACIEKLQKVLDAAGRYKYTNPTHDVEVRLAGYDNPTTAEYYHPLRTSDPSQADNVRSWSLMVPRGVTLKGGFADDFSGSQDILGKKTILDGGYKTTSGEQTKAYHVVTFTDRIYDPDGHPYLATDASRVSTGASSSFASGLTNQVVDENTLLHMSSGKAVLNGLFIQNGNADGIASNTSATKTYTGYGGAAVVPGFASIRNCIVQNNNALYGGGGLYLQQGATVCGTLIKSNTAKLGGGVYFEELDRTPRWTNFSTENALALVSSTVMQFAQLVNSTVTANTATSKGGGIYFDNNAHVMSSAIWGNNCGDQANVAGHTNAYNFANADEITFAKYPFCYSAVENNRLPGANNISVASDNNLGVRFLSNEALSSNPVDLTKYAQTNEVGDADPKINPFYRISDFSQLAKGGSSVQSFMLAVQVFGATTEDYAGTSRVSPGFDYVDIGATAIQQEPKNAAEDITTILPRLYVAQAKDVDKDAQQAMIESNDPIYSQKGSSFAYPFQSLDEALEYIRNLRKKTEDSNHVVYTDGGGTDHYVWEFARNIPFEIIMGKGFYYPSRDIYNVQGESLGNTFLVPEGVSIVGGFDVRELATIGGTKRFYGQKYQPLSHGSATYAAVPDADNIAELMAANLQALAGDSIVVGSTGCRMIQLPIEAMKSPRAHSDNNVNNIIEPWEFTYQTVLSGKVINSDEAANAYHVVSVIADETLVGALPVGYDLAGYNAGKSAKEKGAPVELNGVQIADGQAYRYSKTAANGFVWMDYYHGGGLMVDGNWYRTYNNDGTVKEKYQNQQISNSVGYRNIPLIVDRCHFTNNKGGYGGAISTNTDLNMSNNSFTSNQAIAYKDAQVVYSVDGEAIAADQSNASNGKNGNPGPHTGIYYPGNGGAVYSTKQLIAANCMFENNEATNTYNSEPVVFKSPRSVGGTQTYQYGGSGGAVYSGSSAIVMFFNCNFVRNKANMYPCVFARYPNHYKLGVSEREPSGDVMVAIGNKSTTVEPTLAYNRAFGCVFWGNEGTNTAHRFSANQVFASAPVLSDYTLATGVPNTQAGAYQLLPDYDQSKSVEEWQAIFDQGYSQSLWFCAFEEHTHMTPHRDYDVRLSEFSFYKFVERSIREYVYKTYIDKDQQSDYYSNLFNVANDGGTSGSNATYDAFLSSYVLQDYNQIIHSDNSNINGPNFTKPSNTAGLAGYMQDADWMPKRINRLTDNGWGYIMQLTNSGDNDGVVYAENDGVYEGDGAFFTVLNSNDKFRKYVSMGNETYMIFDAKNVSNSSTSKTTINRISKMPTPTVPTFDNQESYAYIDIGVFEFQHQRLGRPLGDVDYIWVAPAEKPENGGAIGTSWLRPTSDIQRAIETLLSNRNGHKKYLYIIEGDYKPFYNLTPAGGSSMDYNAGFTINTENLNSVALAPDRCTNNLNSEDLSRMYVESLTIVGGFSKEVQTTMSEYWAEKDALGSNANGLVNWYQEGELDDDKKYELRDYLAPDTYRDSESYPVVFYSDNGTSHTMLDIVDARQWYGRAAAGNWAPNLTLKGTVQPSLIPITIDGISFNNSSAADNPTSVANSSRVGSAINYINLNKFNDNPLNYSNKSEATVNAPVSGAPKLTISNCRFYGNGVDSQDIPAVNIATAGGKSLIYNSLFHHNNGTAVVGGDVTMINNTIALNKGGVSLSGANNQMHGNVLWSNTNEYTLPTEMTAADAPNFTFNAVSVADANLQNSWTAGQHNLYLGTTNDDIQNGPNFVDPENGDFHLKPSLKLLNAMKDGLNDKRDIYYNFTTGGTYSSLSSVQKDEYWEKEKDLQTRARLVDDYIDLGAYEYQNKLLPYAFYNPNVNKSGDGSTWEKAYGFGNLQNAIDLVAVATSNGGSFGYVFAKGGRDGKATGESIIMRNGVQVYGSIASGYVKEPATEDVKGQPTVTVATISEYSIDLRTQRPGVAGPTTDRTVVENVSSTTGTTTINTVCDGFEVVGALNMHPANEGNMIFSNSIVCSNPADGNQVNTSKVWNTLVYNTLFRGEYTQLDLQDEHAYAVNVTSQLPLLINGNSLTTNATMAANQVVNCRDEVTPTRILVDESRNVMDPNLEFQLTEDDEDNFDKITPLVYVPGVSDEVDDNKDSDPLARINYEYRVEYEVDHVLNRNYPIMYTDRDLLGNPRKIGAKADKGAFESWRIAGDVHLNYQETEVNGSVVAKIRNFPHEGSYVYMAPGANMILDASLQENKTLVNGVLKDAVIDPGTGKATKYAHPEYAVVPGYVLMREGASVYGQGQSFLTNKISVEKSVNKYGEVIALPFAMKYMQSTGSAIEGTSETNTPMVYTYNGERRSMRDNFYGNGWKQMSDRDYVVPACEGVRFEPYGRSSIDPAKLDTIHVLFTATGKSVVDYAYIETGATKTVQLTSHDEYGTTTAEDMGWNCFGSPYLVANFQTDEFADNTYSLHIPHYLYQYHYPMSAGKVTGNGDYLKVPSWEQYDTNDDGTPDTHPTIILGEGVFTQTATFNEFEDLVFKAPRYVAPPSPSPEYRSIILFHTMGSDGDEDMEEDLNEGYEIKIYVKNSELHVEGLQGGETLVVCSTDARVEVAHTVEDGEHEYVTFITPGAHVVRVDNQSVVVMNAAK